MIVYLSDLVFNAGHFNFCRYGEGATSSAARRTDSGFGQDVAA